MLFVFDSDDELNEDDHYPDFDEHLHQIIAASAIDNDLDFAFNLQVQEAINASLSIQQPAPSPPSSAIFAAGPSRTVGKTSGSYASHSGGQLRLERLNCSSCHTLAVPMRLEDENPTWDVGKSADDFPEEDMDHCGVKTEGIFTNVNSGIFRVYCKGLIEKQSTLQNFKTCNEGLKGEYVLCGIGVSICDSSGNSIFDIGKPLQDNSICGQAAEVKALIEGLNVALAFGIRRVTFHCDSYPIFQYAIGKWQPSQQKVELLVKQLIQLYTKFAYCIPAYVSRDKIMLANSLAREAIEAQKIILQESSGVKSFYETCMICLEDTEISKIFSVDDCMHRYCFSCMIRYVEAQLWCGILPNCPNEGCKSELKIDSCSKFLTSTLVELMTQLLKEASIPVTDKLYCPYPKCSALMSKTEVLQSKVNSGIRSCVKCNGQFCIDCSVPWHAQMTCLEYKARYPFPSINEILLKSLADTQSWRKCLKCNHVIELAGGCYHMTCRCGYEFCYTCGAEYRDKKATCICLAWDDDYIFESDEDYDNDVDWIF